ncbi:MAG TPA: hypothetical protein VLU47_12695 [Blastocatellia bacterium]|nr:hypothetical protein [Blastocatellia bacterium]
MFEQRTPNEEKDRSRSVMIVSGIAVGVVVVLIILASTVVKGPAPLEIAHSGSPEFESYKEFVRFANVRKTEGERLNTRFGRIVCRVENAGDKSLLALKLRAAALDHDDVVVSERIIAPKIRRALEPNQAIDIDVYLEPIPADLTLKDMTIEVYGLKVK